ncbi:MAG TPA: citrate/2-methylcitrate synthase [Thermoplasmata archaeon]|jgi:citrate synthase|nr:citrate/2-methylcitrate synthase [Thermoplasmata archaeon]
MGTSVNRPEIIRGLEDVYVKESKLCLVDGVKGRLLYVGYDIRDLAEHSSFEETAFLLWNLRLPRMDELDTMRRAMGEERKVPEDLFAVLKSLPKATVPIDALRTAISALAGYDPELADHGRDSNLRKALRITAKTATLVAAIERLRSGKRPVDPDPSLGHAADFLRMLTGKAPDETTSRVMDVALILHADHSLAASTFAATVAASTLADVYSTVVAGLAAFKGPLHGGANEQAVNMLLKIGNPANAEAYVKKALAKGEKIPGFGHRVYKTFDPRALILKDYSKKLAERAGDMKLYETALAVEEVMVRELSGKRVYPNVDFWAGVTYYLLDLPPELYTPIFAVARMSGWTAHVIEYWQTNKILRPLDFYTGPTDAKYVPVDRR